MYSVGESGNNYNHMSTMQLKNYNVYFFFTILFAISVVTAFILRPFFVPLAIAAVLAIVFHNLYQFILVRSNYRKHLAALFSSFFILLLVLVPFSLFLYFVGNEIADLYATATAGGDIFSHYIEPFINKFNNSTFAKLYHVRITLQQDMFVEWLKGASGDMLSFVQGVYQGVANFVLMTFVAFFSLYYFFVEGDRIVKRLMTLSPLRDKHEKLLVEKFVSITRATVKGTLVVALVQGSIGGIAFAIAGIKSATLWGIAMTIFSLLPLIGSSIIWLPAAIILLILGNIAQGVFILIVGAGIISVLDNLLRPRLVGKNTQMHPLLVFLATLGGISLFGFSGFIIGPIIVALFLSLWNIYAVEFKVQLRKYNM